MDIVKKNILSLVCAAVALLAVISLFWPVGGMYADTQAELNKASKLFTDVSTIRKAARYWPIIPDVTTGVKLLLPHFPTEEVIKTGKDIKERVHVQTTEIRAITSTNNRHAPLLRDALPIPRDNAFPFAREYMKTVKETFPQMLGAGVPPADKDVDQAGTTLWTSKYATKVVVVDGKPINQDSVLGEWQKETSTLQTKMYRDVAGSIKIYIDPDPISIQRDMVDTTKPPTDTAIWYAQNMLWVQGDVIAAIAQINASAKNVMDAPIKHLIRLEMGDDASQYLTLPSSGNGGDAAAAAIAPGKVYALTPTGRASNPLYDVASFTLTMNVDVKKLPSILVELERGRLITIKQCDIAAVDGMLAADNGYLYGPVPVIKVTLRGEELLLREWTVPMMPDAIKTALQVPATPATPGQPTVVSQH